MEKRETKSCGNVIREWPKKGSGTVAKRLRIGVKSLGDIAKKLIPEARSMRGPNPGMMRLAKS